MLNFAEQTGSGAVIVVWSFLSMRHDKIYNRSVTSAERYTEVFVGSSIVVASCQVRSYKYSE
jgi:adenylylsulfate kinase-like enzyme